MARADVVPRKIVGWASMPSRLPTSASGGVPDAPRASTPL